MVADVVWITTQVSLYMLNVDRICGLNTQEDEGGQRRVSLKSGGVTPTAYKIRSTNTPHAVYSPTIAQSRELLDGFVKLVCMPLVSVLYMGTILNMVGDE